MVSRSVGRQEVERRLTEILRINGEEALNAVRDQARRLAPALGLAAEYRILEGLIAALLRSRDSAELTAPAAGGPKDVALLAFYADCLHEVRPVRSGYRVALTYQLHYRDATRGERAPGPIVERLAREVDAYFATPIPRCLSMEAPQRPDRLTYLLDHEYTEKSLSFDRLKSGDRLRVGALLQVAERLGCEACLALADIHETWSCSEEDDWRGYGRRGRRSWRRRDELSVFLRDRARVEHAWPLAKDRRQHVHQMLDGHRLPVSHETMRKGSPFTLMLKKQRKLFEKEAALRKQQQALLLWLRKEHAAFTGAEGECPRSPRRAQVHERW